MEEMREAEQRKVSDAMKALKRNSTAKPIEDTKNPDPVKLSSEPEATKTTVAERKTERHG